MTFEEAVEKYQPIITQEAARAAYSWRREQEDLEQECKLQLWRNWPKWIEADNPGAMVRTICRRYMITLSRKADRDMINSVNYDLHQDDNKDYYW